MAVSENHNLVTNHHSEWGEYDQSVYELGISIKRDL